MRWFADYDMDTMLVQPVLDLSESEGILAGLEIWFRTEDECETFIEEHLTGGAA